MDEFEMFWKENFPAAPPLSFVLRGEYTTKWIRLHSLPDSKRYATSSTEYETILKRANELGSAVLHRDECWLVAALFNPVDIGESFEPSGQKDLALKRSFRWLEGDDADSSEDEWTFYTQRTRWISGGFDGLLRAIANDEEPRALWVSVATRAIFAPYDGGFDMILPDAMQAEKIRNRYPEWVPNAPTDCEGDAIKE